MGQPTYKDLLEFLGLSNWQFVILAILILTIYSIVTWLASILDRSRYDHQT